MSRKQCWGCRMSAELISLIMTRPAESNTRFIDEMPHGLRAHFRIVLSPLIEIVPCDAGTDIGVADAVIFTSANGVRFAPPGQGRKAYCVGDATRQAAADRGWLSQCLGATSDALVAELKASPTDAMLWHLSGVHARGDVAQNLSSAGINTVQVPLYDQKLLPLSDEAMRALTAKTPSIVPVFSPRTAQQFVRDCPKDARPYLIALSAAVAGSLSGIKGAFVEIAGAPNAPAMLESLAKTASRVRLG